METVPRRAARVILLDEAGRALLIRYVIPRGGASFAFWATPGGGVDDGETDLAAARRELAEELNLDVEIAGPVHTAVAQFEFGGVPIENTDIFFVGRCEAGDMTLAGVDEAERSVMHSTRWWSAEEIDGAGEPVFPPDLSTVIRRLRAA